MYNTTVRHVKTQGGIFIENWLFVLNPLHPYRDHNSNLVLRLIPYMDVNAKICTLNDSYENKGLPKKIDGFPISFAKRHKWFEKAAMKLLFLPWSITVF